MDQQQEAETMTAAATGSAEPSNIATLPVTAPPRRSEVRVVSDPIPVLDTARFEHMQRIANVMSYSNLVPDALCKVKHGDNLVALTPDEIRANCFLVVNQAVRWGMDPFAVAQCVSVVHGKLCYEGKLIAAVLDAKLGMKLEYEFAGDGEAMSVTVRATVDGKPVLDSKGEPKTVTGTVAEWKTTGNNSPWSARGGYRRMLRYRGSREWVRAHEPSIMLGVYSPDEMDDLGEGHRTRQMRDVTPRADNPPDPPEPPAPTAPTPSEPTRDPVDEPFVETSAAADLVEASEQRQLAQAAAENVVWEESGERPATDADKAIEEQHERTKARNAAFEAETAAKATPKASTIKPAPTADELDIPPNLDRRGELKGKDKTLPVVEAKATEIFDLKEELDWLSQIGGALAGCESVGQLMEATAKYVEPFKEKASKATQKAAEQAVANAFARITTKS
jgi:hypothetical protein